MLAAVLLLAAAALALLGVCIGSAGFDGWAQLERLVHGDGIAQQIVLQIRLPRTLGAWLTGALLGLGGALAQGLLRNPLADPYLLGSASGASLGVALLLAALSLWPAVPTASGAGGVATGLADSVAIGWAARLGLTGAAFIGALTAALLTLALARGVQQTLRLLLAGVVVGMVLGAAASWLMLWLPPIMRTMQGFMLGSTAFIGWPSSALLGATLLICLLPAWVLARALDALTLGENTALSLGLPLARVRAALIGVLALATGAAVAQAGLIAFVGLAAPHLARTLARPTHRALTLLATLLGGALLLAADVLARTLLAPRELPVGVLTALIGGGYLLWLMRAKDRS
ncbi:MAG: iron ABC transporter permease [Burkholderiaceae bacterium]|jgi:iron complex transport system permease protein|nr:iron ABC transporter permease [Burkholderiaceae bacterium]